MAGAGSSALLYSTPTARDFNVQPEEEIQILIEDEDESNDSALGDNDDLSDTNSIASIILRHRFEHGRRYHAYKEGSYWGPNDDIQNDQLDIGHHLYLLLLEGKLYLAPIEEPMRILDIGTGTGIWAIDIADGHPAAEVLGIDLSPTQPSFVPANCRFEIDDCTSNWTFPLDHFDLIHIRLLYGSVSDWPRLYEQSFDHLEPGGWLDQLEMDIQFKSDDGTCPPENDLSIWSSICIGAGEEMGKTFKVGEQAQALMRSAGFINVTERRYKVPVGGWSSHVRWKEIGIWNLLHCYLGAEGWGLFLLRNILNWSMEEANVFIAKFKAEMKNKNTHSYFEVWAVYGQKPP